jgi:hypothetical protein
MISVKVIFASTRAASFLSNQYLAAIPPTIIKSSMSRIKLPILCPLSIVASRSSVRPAHHATRQSALMVHVSRKTNPCLSAITLLATKISTSRIKQPPLYPLSTDASRSNVKQAHLAAPQSALTVLASQKTNPFLSAITLLATKTSMSRIKLQNPCRLSIDVP